MDRSKLSHIETSALIAFIEVAERGSFTNAAAALNLSQPTVSQQIKRLEQIVGIKLLHRRSNKVYLTQAGEAFISYCQTALRNIETGMSLAVQSSQTLVVKVTLGLTCFNTQRYLSEILKLSHQRNPNISVDIIEYSTDDLIRGLQNQTIDLAIFSLPVPAKLFQFEDLYEEPLLLVVASTHPLASAKKITWQDMHGQALIVPRQETDFGIRNIIEKLYRTHQIKMGNFIEVSGCQSLHQFLLSNSGLAFLPLSQVQKDLENGSMVVKQLPELSLTHRVVLATDPRYPLSPAAKNLIETMQIVIQTHGH
ncbi:LysR family transcriptional regulator [Leptothoe kymatousa]|uniref:LysR family transcriptional regulator n=1 Tax=Leptothoe kymatousa TAU-MAC 1615 TaxID=2364775 RepID=A0ABS5Y327_9CYAN|nr:LysR family transcriptional regulator [Leptothoe kymatousa]MBT9312227.1 LysR family transcriptional regulator [Leptothoe kymatousa TAU-MAC 1615]